MKCKCCENDAIIRMKRSKSALCHTHLNDFVFKQTIKAIKEHSMLNFSDKVMVCVSGGKDSLALWKVLNDLGYNTTGMYISLGIGDYSLKSKSKVIEFAKAHNLNSIIVDLVELDESIPVLAKLKRRHPCSICGLVKRHHFDKVAYDNGFDVIATGHNLDDEAARLMGNFLHWELDHIRTQSPTLEARGEMTKRKVKPLIRMTEREIAAFAIVNGIDYIIDECPLSKGATSLEIKHMLNYLEDKSPGSKHNFMIGYLKYKDQLFTKKEKDETSLKSCECCGYPTHQDVCGYCRLLHKV